MRLLRCSAGADKAGLLPTSWHDLAFSDVFLQTSTSQSICLTFSAVKRQNWRRF